MSENISDLLEKRKAFIISNSKDMNKRLAEEKKEKEEAKRKKEIRRIEDYFNSVPLRYKESSFFNFIGLDYQRKQVEKGTGGIIYGPNGNGKTHLGYAACRVVVENGGTAILVRAYDFFNEIKREFNDPKLVGKTLDKYAKYNLVVVDEADKKYGSQTEFLSLFNLVNRRYEERLPTYIIGNADNIKQLAEFLTVSCLDKLREGEEVYISDKSKRGKDEQAALQIALQAKIERYRKRVPF